MRHLVVLLLLFGTGHAMAQPVIITFTGGSEFGTEMDSLTAEYVITLHGPYHYRKISKIAFTNFLPDSARIQKLQSKDIDVYIQTKLVAPIVLSTISKKPGVRTLDNTNAVGPTSLNDSLEVIITFQIGSELKTQVDSLSDSNVITRDGPYSYSKIKKMNFLDSLPDTGSLRQLQSKDIQVYLKSKRIAPVVPDQIMQQSVAGLPDSTKAPTSYPDRYSVTRSSAPGPAPPQIDSELLYSATVGFAVGIGLDYGGIGMKLTAEPTNAISFFGGLGSTLTRLVSTGGLNSTSLRTQRFQGFCLPCMATMRSSYIQQLLSILAAPRLPIPNLQKHSTDLPSDWESGPGILMATIFSASR